MAAIAAHQHAVNTAWVRGAGVVVVATTWPLCAERVATIREDMQSMVGSARIPDGDGDSEGSGDDVDSPVGRGGAD